MYKPAISFPIFGDYELNPPNAVSIFGFSIYLYGIIIAFGFILAGLYAYRRRDDFGLTSDNILDILLISVAGGIVGARLYYIAFNPSMFFGSGKWLNIFRLREGGLAVYGGIILAVIILIVYSRVKKIKLTRMLDIGMLSVLIGQSIGRWGNFVNREAHGGETSVPWRMGLHDANGSVYVHPTFLYESLWCALGFAFLHIFSKKYKKYDGQIFLLYAVWYGAGRAVIEGLRTDSLYIANIRVSQLVSLFGVILSLALMIAIAVRSKKRPETQNTADSDSGGV